MRCWSKFRRKFLGLFLDTTTNRTELRRKKISLLVELLFFL